MNTRPIDQDSDQPKTWEGLLSELQKLEARNAALSSSAAKNANTDSTGEGNVEEELRRANRALRVLARCKEAMIRADNEDTLLKKICRIIVKEGGYRLAWIGYIENDEQKTVRPVARAGYDEGYVDKLKIALNDPVRGNGPTGICLKMGKPYRSRNVRTDKDMRPWSEDAIKRGYISTLNLPIAYEKQVIGTLAIYSGDVDAFDREERKLLFELAQTMAYGITAIRDRDRRTKAEDALRESEERFSYALKAAQEGIWDWNMETDEVYYSPRYKEMLGYPEDEIEPHASAWVRLIHPDDRERALQVVDAAMHGEREYVMEFRMRHKDGHYLDILSRGYPIRRDPGGPVTRIVGTHMDITERKRMEEAIRESEAHRKVAEVVEAERRRLFDVLENLPAMICLLTRDHHIAFANRNFREKFGESQGRHCYENRFGRTEPCELCDSFKVLETGKPHRREINSSDGSVIEVYDIPFTDADGSTMVLEMDIDITERERAEDALKESEERFKAFMDNSPAIAWMKDAEGRYVYLNKTYEEEFGVQLKDWLKKTDFDIWPHETAEQFRKNDLEVLVSDHLTNTIDETPDTNGQLRFWYNIKFPIRDASGNMLIGGIGIDITRQKQIEEALKEAKSRNDLYVDLMGHDINNINQVVMGYLELAAESLNLPNDKKELLLKPLDALKSSVKLIENVQKLRKLESGGLKTEAIDLNDILLELKNEYAHYMDKNVMINYTIPRSDCRVMANGLLKDVFTNLIGNAVKHTPGKCAIINLRLVHTYRDKKKYYKVVVEDTGPGIPDLLKHKIFNRFERGTTKAHGKGLGLYLVKTLVDDFHGEVWAEDRIKGDHTKGSRFVVILPAFEGKIDLAQGDMPHVGIVENDHRLVDLYKRALVKYGMHVDLTAENGMDAVDMVRNGSQGLDFIIMDYRLPGMTGLEATKEIRKIAPRIKIIFLSADKGIEKEALDAGAYKVFSKPVSLKEIVQAISSVSS